MRLSRCIYAEVNGRVNTRVAIVNATNGPATLTFYITNSDGNNWGECTTTLPAFGKIAAFLNEEPFF
jgi:hypothetical protein